MTTFPFSRIKEREIETVFKICGEVKNKTLLDLGSGPGIYSLPMLKNGVKKITMVDFSELMLKKIKHPRVETVLADAESFRTKKRFDLIFAMGIFEFVSNPLEILKNTLIMAKPCSEFLILYPMDNFFSKFYKLYYEQKKIEISVFKRNYFHCLVRESGWKIKQEKFVPPFSMISSLRVARF